MKWLLSLLAYLLGWGPRIIQPQPPLVNISASVDPVPVITAGLNTAGEAIKLTAAELAVLNSPAMMEARRNEDEQAARDAIRQHAATALKTGDLTGVNEDLQ